RRSRTRVLVLGTKRQSLSTNYLSQLNDCDLVGFSFRLPRPARHYCRTLIRLRPSVAPVLMTMIATGPLDGAHVHASSPARAPGHLKRHHGQCKALQRSTREGSAMLKRSLETAGAEVIDVIHQHRLLTTSQLRELVLPERGLRRTQQVIAELARCRLLDSVASRHARPGPGERVWFLSRRGA